MRRAWRWIFGKKLTAAELLKRNKRALSKSIRQLDRERFKMEMQEKKLIVDIKKMASSGQMDAVKIMAKDLVHTRSHIKKFMLMKANLQAVEVKIISLDSQQKMTEAMRGVTFAMRAMNTQLRLPQVQLILRDFERQTAVMDMKSEIMEESIDQATEGDSDEEESARIISEICDELGLQLKDQLSGLPPTHTFRSTEKVADTSLMQSDDVDEQLLARLENLKRPDNNSPGPD